ncbi:hypothetical protein PV04_03872 [Phialophora macrospora]|uniref:Ubiquitin 3 binding protein But2 C-terminal domain-containing protein n=1 Tax=Phialophora macrospora TaxID=1851006 RepID=A0A0D2EBR2_9EURO|nr:hypothetical protein PV04_03872 [Phialophora macrospora]
MYARSIVAGLLSFAALSTAAPLVARTESDPSSVRSNVVPIAPFSSPNVRRQAPGQQPIATLLPDFTSQYTSSTGAVDFHTSRGLVSRYPQNGGQDITTLVTFELPSEYGSNECQLVFDLGNDPSAYVAGTGQAQLFTSLAPAYEDTSTWPNGNLRNQHLGTIQVDVDGRAVWEAGSGPGATVDGMFPCSAIAGMIYGGEVVPVGDTDTISWAAGSGDGPKILVW